MSLEQLACSGLCILSIQDLCDIAFGWLVWAVQAQRAFSAIGDVPSEWMHQPGLGLLHNFFSICLCRVSHLILKTVPYSGLQRTVHLCRPTSAFLFSVILPWGFSISKGWWAWSRYSETVIRPYIWNCLPPKEWFFRVGITCILQAIGQLYLLSSCAPLEVIWYLGKQQYCSRWAGR